MDTGIQVMVYTAMRLVFRNLFIKKLNATTIILQQLKLFE